MLVDVVQTRKERRSRSQCRRRGRCGGIFWVRGGGGEADAACPGGVGEGRWRVEAVGAGSHWPPRGHRRGVRGHEEEGGVPGGVGGVVVEHEHAGCAAGEEVEHGRCRRGRGRMGGARWPPWLPLSLAVSCFGYADRGGMHEECKERVLQLFMERGLLGKYSEQNDAAAHRSSACRTSHNRSHSCEPPSAGLR
jgi:hypothetical protein